MKQFAQVLILLLLSAPADHLRAQCQSVAMADSSFESGEFYGYSGEPETGKWFYDDGILASSGGFTGNKSACSNGGGAFQVIRVDSNTTYFASAYILNGANEEAPYPHFRINWNSHPVSVSTNNWTFISTSFDSGSDTIAIVGFYSMGACFDEFRITCSPLTSLDALEDTPRPYLLPSNISSDHFRLTANKPLTVKILTVNGHLVEQWKGSRQTQFGSNLATGMYLLSVQTDSGSWVEKLIKL